MLNKRWDEAMACMSIKKGMQQWSNGDFLIKGEDITFKGEPLPRELHDRILGMYREGKQTFEYLLKFWERLQANPSYRSVQQLYRFLQNAHIPIGPNGHFYVYKSVRGDLKDHHTATYDNSPGVVNRLPRNKVSDDPAVPCHEGFHVGSKTYAGTFNANSKMVICDVDPANVVCVPNDSASGKMRVCEYASIGVWTGTALPDLVWDPAGDNGRYITRYVAPKGMDVVPGLPRVGEPAPSVHQKDTPPVDSLVPPAAPVQTFDVVLLVVGKRKGEILHALRATMDKNFADIEALVDQAPVKLVEKVPQQAAIDLKAKLINLGAQADFYSAGQWVAPEKPKKEEPKGATPERVKTEIAKSEAATTKGPQPAVTKTAPPVAKPGAVDFSGMSREKMRPIAKANGVPRFGKLSPEELRSALRQLQKDGKLKM